MVPNITMREFYLQRQRAEAPVFLKVLQSLPADHIKYKPHDRSPSAEQLVWTLTGELRACLDVVTQNKAEWNTQPPPPLLKLLLHNDCTANEPVVNAMVPAAP